MLNFYYSFYSLRNIINRRATFTKNNQNFVISNTYSINKQWHNVTPAKLVPCDGIRLHLYNMYVSYLYSNFFLFSVPPTVNSHHLQTLHHTMSSHHVFINTISVCYILNVLFYKIYLRLLQIYSKFTYKTVTNSTILYEICI